MTNVATIPQPVQIPATPTGPDPETTILTVDQLRTAVVAESGLEQDDLDSLKVATIFRFGDTTFQVGEMFPGTEQLPAESKLYVFAIFSGDTIDVIDDHVTGDQRVYVIPVAPSNPKSKDWRLFTFSRTSPAMRVERMTQATFISEVGGEWYELYEAMNPDDGGGDGEETPDEGSSSGETATTNGSPS